MSSFLKVDIDLIRKTLAKVNEQHVDIRTNSKPLNLGLISTNDNPKINETLELVCKHFKENQGKERVSSKKILNTLLVLGANTVTSRKRFIAYSREPLTYNRGYYNPNNIGYSIIVSTIKALCELGYIKKHIISPRSKSKSKIRSRIEFNTKFKDTFKSCSVESSVNIYIKNKEKKLVPIKLESKVKTLNKKLNIINKALLLSKYTIKETLYSPPQLKRVFNNGSLIYGGRFYVSHGLDHISLPKKTRANIKIDNEETIEIDFNNFYPNLLYSLANEQLSSDPYEIEGYARKEVKFAFIIAINSSDLNSASKALAKKRAIKHQDAKKLIFTIINTHPLINKFFFKKNIALKLHNLDSKIAQSVMLQFIDATNSSILPIHDSFIIKAQFEQTLISIMKSSYNKFTNYNISTH